MGKLDFLQDVEQLVDRELFEYTSVKAVAVGTHGGTLLFSKFKDPDDARDGKHLIAATTSLLFLAGDLQRRIFNQEVSSTKSYGPDEVQVSILTYNTTFSFVLNRELVELEGLSRVFMPKLKEFAMKVSAIVETSEYLEREDIFVKLKRALPGAQAIAIITNAGMPIKVQTTMSEPKLSAIISALQNITNILLNNRTTEYSVISSPQGGFIIHKIDDKRLLGVAIPDSDDQVLGKTLARIKEIIA